MEARSGLTAEQQVGRSSILVKAVELLTTEAQTGVRVKKAPRFPLILMASMEDLVCDVDAPVALSFTCMVPAPEDLQCPQE